MTTLLRTWTVGSHRRRSLLRGAATVLDLRGNTKRQYRLGSSAAVVDGDAIRADFEAVGADLRAAMDRYPASR